MKVLIPSWWDSYTSQQKYRQFAKAAVVRRVLLVRNFSVAFHHQLLLFPLRKKKHNNNKQVNNTCERTDKP